MTITTEFFGGKVAVIYYAKKRLAPFAPEEIEVHMALNGAGMPWGKASIIPLGARDRIYRWQGKGRAAQYYDGERLLLFRTSEYAEKKTVARAADKAKKEADKATKDAGDKKK